KRFQKRLKNLYTPSMPLVFQGFEASNGPRNISYMRSVSAPWLSMMSSGFTTLNFDFDIFSTSLGHTNVPSSSKMNSISSSPAHACLHFLNSVKFKVSSGEIRSIGTFLLTMPLLGSVVLKS